MKITVDIDDNELHDAVFNCVVENLAKDMLDTVCHESRHFDRELRAAIKATLEERADEIIDRCVPIAGEYIGRKGLKKIADKLTEEA